MMNRLQNFRFEGISKKLASNCGALQQRGRTKSRTLTSFSLRGPTEKFTSDRVTEGERALHIFVAGTVNGCTDLQNAKLYEAPRLVGSI